MPTIEQTTNHLIYSVAPPIVCVGLGFLLGRKFKPIRSRSQAHQATPMTETINHLCYSILHATLAGGAGYLVGNLFKCINLSSILGSGRLREFMEKVVAFDRINPYSNFIYCATGCLILPLFCDPHSNPASLVLGITAFTFIPYQVCQRLNRPLTLTGSVLLSALAVCVFWSVRHIEGVLNAPPKKEKKIEPQPLRNELEEKERLITLMEGLGRRVDGLETRLLRFTTLLPRNPSEFDLQSRISQSLRLRSSSTRLIATSSNSIPTSAIIVGSPSGFSDAPSSDPDSDLSPSGSNISATSSPDSTTHASMNSNSLPTISPSVSPSND